MDARAHSFKLPTYWSVVVVVVRMPSWSHHHTGWSYGSTYHFHCRGISCGGSRGRADEEFHLLAWEAKQGGLHPLVHDLEGNADPVIGMRLVHDLEGNADPVIGMSLPW